ncbi:hypothetical protein DVA81_18450, partial [Acinetobacter baumannii]
YLHKCLGHPTKIDSRTAAREFFSQERQLKRHEVSAKKKCILNLKRKTTPIFFFSFLRMGCYLKLK